MTIPGTAENIIKYILKQYKLSIYTIAYLIKSTPKTLYQILNGNIPHPQTDFELFCLYIRLEYFSLNEANKNL